ncbi:MAG: hypothetical protein K9J76_07285 [Polaromonas sp.]|nr:hypothetical protein [Polaromonas sp.]
MKSINTANSVINRVLSQRPVKGKQQPVIAVLPIASKNAAVRKSQQDSFLDMPDVSELKAVIQALKAPAQPALPTLCSCGDTSTSRVLGKSRENSHECCHREMYRRTPQSANFISDEYLFYLPKSPDAARKTWSISRS